MSQLLLLAAYCSDSRFIVRKGSVSHGLPVEKNGTIRLQHVLRFFALNTLEGHVRKFSILYDEVFPEQFGMRLDYGDKCRICAIVV